MNRSFNGLKFLMVLSMGVTFSSLPASATGSVELSKITIGSQSQSIAIAPSGLFAYVANAGGTVSKVDLASDVVASTISISSTSNDMTINKAETAAYVLVRWNRSLAKVDLRSNSVTSFVVGQSPSFPMGVALNAAGTYAYVATNSGNASLDGWISKINLNNETVEATIPIGNGPTSIVINSSGTFAYVINTISKTVSKIDLLSDLRVKDISLGFTPQAIALTPSGAYAYVVGSGGSVSKIDLISDSIVKTLSIDGLSTNGEALNSIAINSKGTFGLITNSSAKTLVKLNLVSDSITGNIAVSNYPSAVSINSDSTFAYVAANVAGGGGTLAKVSLSENETQTISFSKIGNKVFPAPLDQLFGAKTASLTATSTSGLAVALTSETPLICTVTGSIVTFVSVGSCTINANQAGGSGFDPASPVTRTFSILPSPPAGELGISINSGNAYTNTKSISLDLVWPAYATEARISNDGGFAASKTSTLSLAPSIKWDLDDSVKGVYTKVVYVRFSGVGDVTKTYTDDIILDTNAPTIDSSKATAVSGAIQVNLNATDDITGVDKVEIRNGTTVISLDYNTVLSVSEKDLGLNVSASSVRKFDSSSVDIRVSDKAGNWSGYQTLSVYRAGSDAVTSPVATRPKVTTSKSVTSKSIAKFANLAVASTSKVSMKVIPRSAKYCKVSGSNLKGLRVGTCQVTVTVTLKSGRKSSKTISLNVTK